MVNESLEEAADKPSSGQIQAAESLCRVDDVRWLHCRIVLVPVRHVLNVTGSRVPVFHMWST